MRITFLSAAESRAYFNEPDYYALNLPASNLTMINPKNPTIEGYQKVFLESFRDIVQCEKDYMTEISKNLSWLNFDIKISATSGCHALDITQTRKDVIIAAGECLSPSLFEHETYHVLSRQYPSLTPELSKLFGFERRNIEEINHPDFLLNPDAPISDYAIEVKLSKGGKNIKVVPFIKIGLKTGLKILGKEEYIDASDTNYFDLISNTSYLAHPEEICAEYFSLVTTGACIIPSNRKKVSDIECFSKRVGDMLRELGVAE